MSAHRDLVQEYEALNFYRQSLLIKALTKLVKWYRLNKGSGILKNLTLSKQVASSFDHVVRHGLHTEIMQRDWVRHRQGYLLRQILRHWQEHTVKEKLARMLIKKRVLGKLRQYVHQKNH